MNDNTYHVGWVVCLLVCGSRLGVWSFLRWSSTSGIGVCILAAARMRDCLCIPPRHTSTDHSLPHFNSGLPQQRRPPRRRHANQPGSKRPQCMEGILALILKVHDWLFTSLLLNSSLYDEFLFSRFALRLSACMENITWCMYTRGSNLQKLIYYCHSHLASQEAILKACEDKVL